MSDLVGNPEDRVSRVAAHIKQTPEISDNSVDFQAALFICHIYSDLIVPKYMILGQYLICPN